MQIARSSACLCSQCGLVLEHHDRVIKQVDMPLLKPVPAIRQSRQAHLVILLLHSRKVPCQSLAGTTREGLARNQPYWAQQVELHQLGQHCMPSITP